MAGTNERARAQYAHAVVPSPVGPLTLVASAHGLAAVLWPDDRPGRVRVNRGIEQPGHPVIAEAARQLGEYFAGTRRMFTVPLDEAGTPFERSVWEALRTIPYGETRTYGEIADVIGRPSAARAVGAANGRNPISILTPCHRVVGATGSLTGFAGGLETKAGLLALERRALNSALRVG